jgi:hypothetical protein
VLSESTKASQALGRMMVWLFLLLSLPALAETDLSSIQKLDKELPNYSEKKQSDDELDFQRSRRRFTPPTRTISFDEIKKSPVLFGSINQRATLIDIETNTSRRVHKLMYVKYFGQEDESGYKYLQNKNGSITWKVLSRHVEPIKEEVSLYEPPIFAETPPELVEIEYDRKLTIPPEVSIYAGVVQGSYMQDLFNDDEAKKGTSTQYGVHFFTQWKYPIKAGLVLHYERSTYKLSNAGEVVYTSPSLGPQFKTREFEFLGQPLRFQTQFRISPFAKAHAETIYGDADIKFNSSDFMASLERPIKNRFGEFVLGVYVQNQWLNIRDQQSQVRVKASNATNRSYGLSFAQVFE